MITPKELLEGMEEFFKDSPAKQPNPFNRKPRRRRVPMRDYRVLNVGADRHHRRGTWTHVMVTAAITHTNTSKAENWLRENYPEYNDRSLDWRWIADKRYITFD